MRDLITEHIDIWTGAQTPKKTGGRGRGRKAGDQSLYGIKKLRELILDLAVRGRLVKQDSRDESASELLKRIAAEKARLIKAGEIKKQKKLPEIKEEEKNFELPHGWENCRFGTLVNSIMSGGTPSKRNPEYWNGDIPWASVKDLGWAKYLKKTQDHITQKGLKVGSKLAAINDVIICTRMGLGKVAIAKVEVAINQDLKAVKLTSLLDVDYFLIFFATLKITGTGTTVAGIRQNELLNYVFFLPSLVEQHRIVAKVDELMSLCDQLEQQQTNSNATHQTLLATLLTSLTNAPDHAAFTESWQRIANHFDTLFTTEQSIDQLKQTILQFAVMGKLVSQDPNDEPASVLLEKIAKEKARLIKEGKIKKQKKLPEIGEDEKPFSLPVGWEHARLQVIIDVRDGTHDSPKDAVGSITYPLVTSKNFKDGKINFNEARRISAEDHFNIIKRSLVSRHDILFSMIGGNLGNQVMVNDDRPFSIKNVALFKYYDKELTQPFFIKKFLEHLALNLQSKAAGGAQPFVSLTFLRKVVIAVPPIAEQHRIVAKVDELMTLCDTLKTRLHKAQTTQVQLADTIVEQAVAQVKP